MCGTASRFHWFDQKAVIFIYKNILLRKYSKSEPEVFFYVSWHRKTLRIASTFFICEIVYHDENEAG